MARFSRGHSCWQWCNFRFLEWIFCDTTNCWSIPRLSPLMAFPPPPPISSPSMVAAGSLSTASCSLDPQCATCGQEPAPPQGPATPCLSSLQDTSCGKMTPRLAAVPGVKAPPGCWVLLCRLPLEAILLVGGLVVKVYSSGEQGEACGQAISMTAARTTQVYN
jgi:hypothetical protein